MEKYLSVTTLTKYLKMKFDKDPYLERVYLTGQVSNFRKRPTHQYFSLKDDHTGEISPLMLKELALDLVMIGLATYFLSFTYLNA